MDADQVTAQNVVDAIRFVLMAQDDAIERRRLTDMLLELAPETSDNGGFDLVRELLAEGSLKVAIAGVPPTRGDLR